MSNNCMIQLPRKLGIVGAGVAVAMGAKHFETSALAMYSKKHRALIFSTLTKINIMQKNRCI